MSPGSHQLVELYAEAAVPRERLLIKVASTWEGIRAAQRLEREGIHCNLTMLFSFAQAVACAEAGVTLISPFVCRILDRHLAQGTAPPVTPQDDPGVTSVTRIWQYYKRRGYATVVMGASFRNTGQVLALAGCDRLTISPELLHALEQTDAEVPRALVDNGERATPPSPMDEATFRWQHNQCRSLELARRAQTEGTAGEGFSDAVRENERQVRLLEEPALAAEAAIAEELRAGR